MKFIDKALWVFFILIGIIWVGVLVFLSSSLVGSFSEEEAEEEAEEIIIEEELVIAWGIYYYPIVIVEIIENPVVEYNLSEINQEVITTAQKYFENVNFSQNHIIYINDSVFESYYNDNTFEIVIGMEDIEDNPELYKLVLTHEYIHYLLYRMNLSSDDLHEGLADVYTAFLNREAQSKRWGEKNEERAFPYSLFTNQILREDNFDCLYKVFNEDNKISGYEEIINRLEEYCNSNQLN